MTPSLTLRNPVSATDPPIARNYKFGRESAVIPVSVVNRKFNNLATKQDGAWV
ncbi:hypothetical protein [Microcoleus sp. herbarium12]|uniref:hypothetical protein n=1 Tax=Microcoleus sp. herbarium12 TaxID=3055437 RepID=UPI002FD7555E